MDQSTAIHKPLSEYPEILNARNVAEYLNVGYIRALEILKNSTLPSIKIGNTYRITRNKFEEWVNKPEKQVALPITDKQ